MLEPGEKSRNITAADLLAVELDGLLPLVLLTQGGTEPEVVEKTINKLVSTDERGLLTILYTLGGLVFKTQPGQDWFKGRFHMLRDILEESWTYQELKEGARQSVEQKAKQLELNRLRIKLSDVVQKRFPKLARLTKTLGMGIDDADVLLDLIVNITTANTLEEATEILIAMGEREG